MSEVRTRSRPGAAALAAEVSGLLEDVFACVEALRECTLLALAAAEAEQRRPRVADLRALARPAGAILTDPTGLVVGAGLVAARHFLADAPHWLQWWTVDSPGGRPDLLVVETDEQAEAFRDYTALPWFSRPAAHGRRELTGPYVDYLCSDEYSLTFTLPVSGPGGFAGVVGGDVYIRHLERRIAPALHRAAQAEGRPLALVNDAGRVVCGTSAALVTGSLIRDVPAPRATDDARIHPCGALPLSVLLR